MTEQARTRWGRTKFGNGRTPAMAVAVPCGMIGGAAAGWLAVSTGAAGANPGLGFLVFAACLTMPAVALAYVLIVDRNTLRGASRRPEESIESGWYDKAASGSFTDLLLAGGVAAVILGFIPGDLPADLKLVLPGLLAACAASFGIRYLALRRKG